MKQGFLSIVTLIFSLNRSYVTSGAYKENDGNPLNRNTQENFRKVRQNGREEVIKMTEDKKVYKDISFHDYETWDLDKKQDFLKNVLALNIVSESIDWDDLRDKYSTLILSDLEKSKRIDTEKFNKRRRLSSNNLVEVKSQRKRGREMEYKKKKKMKKSKSKGKSKHKKKYIKCINKYSNSKSTKYGYIPYNDEKRMLGSGKGKKVKKKRSKGKSKGSLKATKGKGSQKNNIVPSFTMAPTHIIYGKGKYGHGYPYCPELTSVPSINNLTHSPSKTPSQEPKPKETTFVPTSKPSQDPKPKETTFVPTPKPSVKPTLRPTSKPTLKPSMKPTPKPSMKPTSKPSTKPTPKPSVKPTPKPTSIDPTPSPTNKPTLEKGIYRYDDGNCPAEGALGVPCAEETNIRRICNRYHELGSFAECWKICEPAFCCIHDADPDQNFVAPSCSKDENCAQYAYCYIVWFKFHDTFGPATFLNVEQTGSNFFDVQNSVVRGDTVGNEFFDQLYFHHFDDVDEILRNGLDTDGKFLLSNIFEDPDYWDSSI